MATVRLEKMQYIFEGLKYLDFSFGLRPRKSKRIKILNVEESIRRDWESVGDDLYQSMFDLIEAEKQSSANLELIQKLTNIEESLKAAKEGRLKEAFNPKSMKSDYSHDQGAV